MNLKRLVMFLACTGLAEACLFLSCKTDTSDDVGAAPKTYPAFSPIGGFYDTEQTVSISCDDASVIYYNIITRETDLTKSTIPSESSKKYDGPFAVSEECVIRALAIKKDGTKKYAMTAYDFDTDASTDFSGTTLNITDWQDKVIYFIVTDRYNDGDSSNNKDDDSYDESKVIKNDDSGYHGGDLKGITAKLDYIKDCGFTAIWITPPIKNQVTEGNYHGYHGYWASDFTEVDSHFGTLWDYQNLVSEAHKRGIAVIQDIVVNHTGDYQKINTPVTAEMIQNVRDTGTSISESIFKLNSSSVPAACPAQLPWKMNNPNDLTADEFTNNSFYHFNPYILDYNKQEQMYTYQSSDLDDMATDNTVVENLLRGYFRYWIKKAGIDGYRIDTAIYVQPEFFEGFINSTETDNMGTRPYAASLGKSDFINFGEAWTTDESLGAAYTKSANGTARMDSLIYFPLRFAITNCITGTGSTNAITQVLDKRYSGIYQNPNKLVTFIDNHDVERLLSQVSSAELVKAAYAMIMTLPGVPQVYYGAEQGFKESSRSAMFASGLSVYGIPQTTDHFDETNSWYTFFKNLNSLRMSKDVYRYNRVTVIKDTTSASGLFAYVATQRNKEDTQDITGLESKILYILNTSSSDQVLNASGTRLVSGDKFTLQSPSSAGFDSEITVGKDGGVEFIVPAQSYAVYLLTAQNTDVAAKSGIVAISGVEEEKDSSGNVTAVKINGDSTVRGTLRIVINNDYSNASSFTLASAGSFSEFVSVTPFVVGTNEIMAVVTTDIDTIYSNTLSYNMNYVWALYKTVSDDKTDENGVGKAKGFLKPPTDETFNGQMNIRSVSVYKCGSNLRLDIQTNCVSKTWNPAINQFDHVLMNIFFEKPGSTTGCGYHPNHNYEFATSTVASVQTFKWDYFYKAEGWSNTYYSSVGAGENSNGTSVTPAPTGSVDWTLDTDGDGNISRGTISFIIPAASLGNPSSLTGWKVFIDTYDYDMGKLRAMQEGAAGQWAVGTGTCPLADAPRVLDEIDDVILL